MLRIGLALCGALEHAHSRGVVHRDVKPQNVMVPDAPRSAAGVAKLTDFGVAHLAGDDALTRTGDVVGTLAYMAPEQAAGQRVDERADLYSLALVLYEALAGLNPVRAGSPAATARRVGTVLPALRRSRKDLPEELGAAIDRALRPKPDERGTLDDLAAELAQSLPEVADEGGTVARHPLESTEPLPLPRGLDRAVAAALAGGLVAAALAWAGQPVLPALAAVAAVAVLPRLGWLVAAVATVAMLAVEQPGAAVLVAAALAPVPLLLRRRGSAWSVPALAPLLGFAGLAGAYPALAGRARGPLTRAALGALGAWWALLAAPLAGRTLLLAGPRRAGRRRARARRRPRAAVHQRCAALRRAVGTRRAAAPVARPRSLAARWISSRPPSGPPRWALRAPRSAKPRAFPSRADWSPERSLRASSRSQSPTSVEYRWWSRDAWPDTVHRQSWPPRPGSRP